VSIKHQLSGTAERRSFKMHPKLLFDVIQRQAGTLDKAIGEGIMNAVDAQASRLAITISSDHITFVDNGKGFRSRTEVEQFFETFGQPHDESEQKIYGAFRMGRGQLFSFGINKWRTGEHAMMVDIKQLGLEYDLLEGLPWEPGCRIDVTLYRELLPGEVNTIIRDVKRFAKYVAMPITLNGVQISRDPAQQTWDLVTDDAYINFRETGRLAVYNLGVFVKEFPAYSFSTGGEVVSKQQLRVNFARNDVQYDCPVWRKVVPVLKGETKKKIEKAPRLNDDERQAMCEQLKVGGLDADETDRLPLFTDVTGRHYSAAQIKRWLGANKTRAITVAPDNDRIGDLAMQSGRCFVFSRSTLERFDFEQLRELVTLLRTQDILDDVEVLKYESLAREFTSELTTIPPKKYTPTEAAALELLSMKSRYYLLSHENPDLQNVAARRLLLGEGAAAGWTDGASFICINRTFLRECLTEGFKGWVKLADLVRHEYAHDDPTTDSHNHTPEFYRRYHDMHPQFADFVQECVSYWAMTLATTTRRTNKRATHLLDRLAVTQRRFEEQQRAENKLATATEKLGQSQQQQRLAARQA
jgi:hypothetical protein